MKLYYEEQLQKLFANINEWLKFAEAKNFGLITLNAGIVFGLSQINFEEKSVACFVSFYILSPFIYLSFLFTILSFFPVLRKIAKGEELNGMLSRLSGLIDKEKKFENIHFYGYLRRLNKAKFIDEFKSKTNSAEQFTLYEEELVTQILYNSRITWLKFQLFKIAGLFTLIGILISPIVWFILTWIK